MFRKKKNLKYVHLIMIIFLILLISLRKQELAFLKPLHLNNSRKVSISFVFWDIE